MPKLRISEGSATRSSNFIRVATLEELKTAGMIVVRGAHCPRTYIELRDFLAFERCRRRAG